MFAADYQLRVSNLTEAGLSIAGVLTILLLVTLTGCSDNVTGTGNGNDDCPTDAVCVGMTSSSFTPSNIQIEVGTTVVWTNTSNVAHTVTSGSNGDHDGRFNSGNLPSDGEFTHEFTEAGSFNYYCIPHWQMGMTGTVTVVDSNNN